MLIKSLGQLNERCEVDKDVRTYVRVVNGIIGASFWSLETKKPFEN